MRVFPPVWLRKRSAPSLFPLKIDLPSWNLVCRLIRSHRYAFWWVSTFQTNCAPLQSLWSSFLPHFQHDTFFEYFLIFQKSIHWYKNCEKILVRLQHAATWLRVALLPSKYSPVKRGVVRYGEVYLVSGYYTQILLHLRKVVFRRLLRWEHNTTCNVRTYDHTTILYVSYLDILKGTLR